MKREAACAAVGMFMGLIFCFHADMGGIPMKLAFIGLSAILFVLAIVLLVGRMRRAAMIMTMFMFASSVYMTVYSALCVEPLTALSGETVTVSGIVTDCTDSDVSQVKVVGSIGGINGKVTAYLSGANISSGDRVTFSAVISEITDSASFSAKSYYAARGIYVKCTQAGSVTVEKAAGIYKIYGKLRDYKEKLTTAFCSYAGLNEGQLLASMLCGATATLDSSVRLAMNRSGIGHLLAVSGVHVSIVAALVAYILGLLRVQRLTSFIISEAVLVLFVVFSGMRISAVRAFIMMTVYLASSVLRRQYDGISSLSFGVLVILAFSPYSVADTSFLLSVSGVFGVSVAAPAVVKEFGIKKKTAIGIIGTISAFVCTLPVSLFTFDEISLVSVVTNLILAPFCTAAMCMAFIFAALGAPTVLSPMIEAAGWIMRLIIKACEYISSLGFTYVTVKYSFIPTAVLIALLLLALIFIAFRSVRLLSLLSVGIVCLTVAAIAVTAVFDSENTYLRIISDGDGYLIMVTKGSECIVVDSSGDYASDFGYAVRDEGILTVRALVLMDNGLSNYPSYLDEGAGIENILLTKSDTAKSSSDTEIYELTDGTELLFGDVRLTIGESAATIEAEDFSLLVTDENVSGLRSEYGKISYLYIADGVCVTDVSGEVKLSQSGADFKIKL